MKLANNGLVSNIGKGVKRNLGINTVPVNKTIIETYTAIYFDLCVADGTGVMLSTLDSFTEIYNLINITDVEPVSGKQFSVDGVGSTDL
jgi:hypothetical protein